MEIIYSIIAILITMIFSALFSGMEIAFVTSDKLKIKIDDDKGHIFSGILNKFIKNSGKYLATMLVGNNIALVVYGMLMTQILDPILANYFHSASSILLWQTVISTILILIFSEFMPKTYFNRNANLMLNTFAGFVNIFYIVFNPITRFSVWISNQIMTKILKLDINEEHNRLIFGTIDITHFLENNKLEVEHESEETNLKIFQNALDFSHVKLRQAMTPRTEIEAVDFDDSCENILKRFIETGFSKLLVYKDNVENIIGYFHSADILKDRNAIKQKLRKVLIVPQTMAANKLLNKFIKMKRSIAVVVDEYGGISGMITIEDIMEEIFGEIEDEHDTSDFIAIKNSENEYTFSGRLEIDYINEKFDLNLPKTSDYETIGGFVIMNYQTFPQENERISIENFTVEILKTEETRIELLKLIIN